MNKFARKVNEKREMIKSNKKFLILLVIFAALVIVVIALFLTPKSEKKTEVINEVDYTFNILKNSDFETGNFLHWNIQFQSYSKNFALVDNLVKLNGNFSCNLTSESDTIHLSIAQKIENPPKDKKLILNGKVRTEYSNAVFLSIELYSKKDSILAVSLSDTLRGTNDWAHLTTWVRTINPELSYIVVKCNLVGKGRAWFDDLEMYPVDVEQKTFIPIQR